MSTIAIIRSDNENKVNVALCDLVKYAHMSFSDKPRRIEPKEADEILVNVMDSPLKRKCDAAAVVSLREDASTAINRLRKIHPPAHIIIVSPKNNNYRDVADRITNMPEIDLTVNLSQMINK